MKFVIFNEKVSYSKKKNGGEILGIYRMIWYGKAFIFKKKKSSSSCLHGSIPSCTLFYVESTCIILNLRKHKRSVIKQWLVYKTKISGRRTSTLE